MISPGSVRILVIEDDDAIRATLTDILQLNGYVACGAVDGSEGLASARREPPDLVISDVSMPGLDGFALLEALRGDDKTRAIPVILISASIEPERMRQGMDLGAEDYIVKPFTEDQVLRSVRARLEKKALLDELDAYAHTVAHDLKNPIAALSMRAELLQMTWASGDDAHKKEQIANIGADIRRLANIVDELLVLAGVRRHVVTPRLLDMAPLVQEALARVAHLIKPDVVIRRPVSWPAAGGHGPWVVEIWTNYISNALKYGGTPPRVTLGADPLPVDGRRRFWVKDEGAGLSAEQQALLFRPFSRVTETRARGHGLGLSIVRRIAEKLGGRAGVESAPGAGCLFWFELSASPPPPPPGAPLP